MLGKLFLVPVKLEMEQKFEIPVLDWPEPRGIYSSKVQKYNLKVCSKEQVHSPGDVS